MAGKTIATLLAFCLLASVVLEASADAEYLSGPAASLASTGARELLGGGQSAYAGESDGMSLDSRKMLAVRGRGGYGRGGYGDKIKGKVEKIENKVKEAIKKIKKDVKKARKNGDK